jgi:hypothetical protein
MTIKKNKVAKEKQIPYTKKLSNIQDVDCFLPLWLVDSFGYSDTTSLPPNATYDLMITYPLTTPASFKVKTGKKGMSILKLVSVIGEFYDEIFMKEAATFDEKKGCGMYGLAGQEMEDLVIENIKIDHLLFRINLSIGS